MHQVGIKINLSSKCFYNTFGHLCLVRPWTYQTCNEFGWFQTSSSRKQHFGTKYPLAFFTTICKDVFGTGFTNDSIHSQIMQTNSKFRGKKLQVDNVYRTHGELDPWRKAGMDEQQEMVTMIPSKFIPQLSF